MFNSDIKYDIPEANLQVKETKCLGLSSSPPPHMHFLYIQRIGYKLFCHFIQPSGTWNRYLSHLYLQAFGQSVLYLHWQLVHLVCDLNLPCSNFYLLLPAFLFQPMAAEYPGMIEHYLFFMNETLDSSTSFHWLV